MPGPHCLHLSKGWIFSEYSRHEKAPSEIDVKSLVFKSIQRKDKSQSIQTSQKGQVFLKFLKRHESQGEHYAAASSLGAPLRLSEYGSELRISLGLA